MSDTNQNTNLTSSTNSSTSSGGGMPKGVIVAIVIVLLIVGGFYAAGFFIMNKIKTKMAQAGVTGFNYTKDGTKFTVKTKEGDLNVQAGTDIKLPAAFPKELLYPGAQVQSAVDAAGSMTVTLKVPSADAKTMRDWYTASLKGAGWTVDNPTGDGGILAYTKGTTKGILTIVVEKGVGAVIINIGSQK
jgi:hypothetical protein